MATPCRASSVPAKSAAKPEKRTNATPTSITPTAVLFTPGQAACSCGGGCPRCHNLSSGEKLDRESAAPFPALSLANSVVSDPGHPLDTATRGYFQSRLQRDLSHVRIHTDARAAASAEALGADAYAVGSHVAFASGRFAAQNKNGRRLIAHELAHTIQQGQKSDDVTRADLRLNEASRPESEATQFSDSLASGRRAPGVELGHYPISLMRSDSTSGGRYTEEQRQAMVLGRLSGTPRDLEIAAGHHMEPGDVVFRLGSSSLARIIENPVTHGGIYVGDGMIHDMVGFGNRTARLSDFYAEAEDPSVVRVLRFIGPQRVLIVERLLQNIRARNFNLPTDPVPFNLFSRADDYQTATCLEYSHAQFLYAIQELSTDPLVTSEEKAELAATYFTADGRAVRDLIAPQELSEESSYSPMDSSNSTEASMAQLGASITPSLTAHAMVAAADYLADDVDSTRFDNRWEGHSSSETSGPWWYQTTTYRESIRVFTYRSFVESTQFFNEVH
jgi:hypothetical protein